MRASPRVGTNSPGQPTSRLVLTQLKETQPAQVRQAASLLYSLLDKYWGKHKEQYSSKPCVKLQIPLPGKGPRAFCPRVFWFPLASPRKIKSALVPSSPSQVSKVLHYKRGTCSRYFGLIWNIKGGFRLLYWCVRLVQVIFASAAFNLFKKLFVSLWPL